MMNAIDQHDRSAKTGRAGGAADPQSGMTLMEVLVAISIFAIGILAVAGMQGMAIRGNGVGNQLTDRISLAQTQMENLMGLDYDAAGLANGSYDDGASPPVTSWTVADYTAMADTKLITVTVTRLGKTTSISRVKSRY